MTKILVSACLLGHNCKYNGKNNLNEQLMMFLKDYEVVSVCPEVLGGLNTPRFPSEILGKCVINSKGQDVTKNFIHGANCALKIALSEHVCCAILKQNSPSCGSLNVYDGTFKNKLVSGKGITCKLLEENNIVVYDENNYIEYLKK